MTYNRSEIMKAAWQGYNQFKPARFCRVLFAYHLRQAWAKARKLASIGDLAAHRERLERQLEWLSYSDALGTGAKMRAIRNEIQSLPKAA